MKLCRKCGETKSPECFANDKSSADGMNRRCRECDAKKCREYRKTPEGRAVRLTRYRNDPAKVAAPSRAWWAARPERKRLVANAHRAVQRAVKSGKLVRPPECQQCGTSGPVHAAHSDYTRRLDVRWLCPTCHAVWDTAIPKTAGK